jgi:peroxiredoxin
MKTGAFVLAATLLLAGAAAASPQAGEKAPDFTLKDTDGKEHHLASYVQAGKTVVLEWFNPDCPFVKRHHEKATTMIDLEKKYRDKGVVWLAINSGAPGQQGNGLDRNKSARKEYRMDYPVLLDEPGAVGRLYGAKTTPHMFVIGKDGMIVYAGGIDDDPRGQKTERFNFVAAALDQTLAGKKVDKAQSDPYGCSVKYAPMSVQ